MDHELPTPDEIFSQMLGGIAGASALAAASRIPWVGPFITAGGILFGPVAEASRAYNSIVDEDVESAFGDPNVDPATALRGLTQVYEENFDQFLYNPDGTRKRRPLPVNYANTHFAQAKMGMPGLDNIGEATQWLGMAMGVMDRTEGDKAKLARNLIRARRRFADGPKVHARDEMITGDLDALDRLALVGTDVATRTRNALPGMRAEGTHIKVEVDSDSFFDDLEGDLGLVSTAASGLAPATNALDDRWALYREQGHVPRLTDDEGLVPGTWNLEQSMAHTRDWTSGLPDATGAGPEWSQGAGPIWDPFYEVPGSQFGQAAGEMRYLQNTAGSELNTMGSELERTSNFALRMQDAVGGASYELWELEQPLLRIHDGALGLADAMGSGYGGDGVTGAMDGAGLAADGLALSTGTAEQALLAAGLTGDSTTQVLDLMRSAGLDPATSAWGELATAAHGWGDATDTEVARVIGRLGDLARVQGGGGPGSAGSSSSGGSGGGAAGVDLGRLMALAEDVAEERARMGGKPQDFVDHELGKVLGQLGAPGSVADKLALLRLFFAGSAHGISFGLGPSASSLGFDIPQFAGGGTVPGPLGAPQLIVAHGGEHIVPHRATGSPTIIRIELDREVLSQAVLGDLLRLQGREVTLGLS